MAADDDDLVGMLGTFEVGDYVVAGGFRERLRGEGEMEADGALGGEVVDEVGVFGGEGGVGIPAGAM